MPPDRNLPARYLIRLEDLRRWHRVIVRCRCGHVAVIPAAKLKFGRDPNERLVSLEKRLRCRNCGALGEHAVEIENALR